MSLKPIRSVRNIALAIADHEIGPHDALNMPLGTFVWAWDDTVERVAFGAFAGVQRAIDGIKYTILDDTIRCAVNYSHIAKVQPNVCPQVIDRDNCVHRIIGVALKDNGYITVADTIIPKFECQPAEYRDEHQAKMSQADVRDIPNRCREEGV